jgi:hypothetical protein
MFEVGVKRLLKCDSAVIVLDGSIYIIAHVSVGIAENILSARDQQVSYVERCQSSKLFVV